MDRSRTSAFEKCRHCGGVLGAQRVIVDGEPWHPRCERAQYEAPSRIDALETALAECVAVMSRCFYPRPDVSDDHPWSVLSRARALLEKSN